jgi:polyisoprenoid-binding protein YceI
MKKIVLMLSSFLLVVCFAKTFEVDSVHSEVGFTVKHLLISKVRGKFSDYSAKIDFDSKKKIFKSFSASIKSASVNTGIDKRDKHLRSKDFFYASKFPNIKFKMIKYEANDNEGKMIGDLTIRGVTNRVSLSVEINGVVKDFAGNTRAGVSLKGKINRKDFGLKWNQVLEAGGLAVDKMVKLEIELEMAQLN